MIAFALLVCCCYYYSPIRPIILVRLLPDQLECCHPTGNWSSSLNQASLSVFPRAQFANCTWQRRSYPLYHNNNTKRTLFITFSAVLESSWMHSKDFKDIVMWKYYRFYRSLIETRIGRGLFNLETTMVSVLRKELEYKVEKLKYKKF